MSLAKRGKFEKILPAFILPAAIVCMQNIYWYFLTTISFPFSIIEGDEVIKASIVEYVIIFFLCLLHRQKKSACRNRL